MNHWSPLAHLLLAETSSVGQRRGRPLCQAGDDARATGIADDRGHSGKPDVVHADLDGGR